MVPMLSILSITARLMVLLKLSPLFWLLSMLFPLSFSCYHLHLTSKIWLTLLSTDEETQRVPRPCCIKNFNHDFCCSCGYLDSILWFTDVLDWSFCKLWCHFDFPRFVLPSLISFRNKSALLHFWHFLIVIVGLVGLIFGTWTAIGDLINAFGNVYEYKI